MAQSFLLLARDLGYRASYFNLVHLLACGSLRISSRLFVWLRLP